MAKKILITGGAGFIGSHLAQRLVSEGHSVVSLDNYFTGSVDNHVFGVIYIQGSTENISTVLFNYTFDYVFHLGEYSRVEQSFEDIDLVWKFNKLGTYEVLKYVKKIGAKLIYAGSSTKYADRHEGYVPSPYTWSKESNTEFVKQYCEWSGIDYAITYFYNVYGKREIKTGKYATLIAKFKESMSKGEALTIVSPGTQERNFTHVNDIVNAIVLIAQYGQGDEYGIGNPTAYTVLDVASMFAARGAGSVPKTLRMLDARKGNRMSAKVMTEKTKMLGWLPQLELNKYIEDLRKNGWKDE
jgi:UDP-glucose 4-epimerase